MKGYCRQCYNKRVPNEREGNYPNKYSVSKISQMPDPYFFYFLAIKIETVAEWKCRSKWIVLINCADPFYHRGYNSWRKCSKYILRTRPDNLSYILRFEKRAFENIRYFRVGSDPSFVPVNIFVNDRQQWLSGLITLAADWGHVHTGYPQMGSLRGLRKFNGKCALSLHSISVKFLKFCGRSVFMKSCNWHSNLNHHNRGKPYPIL